MNLPNRLTILRIFLVFIFMFFLFSKGVAAKTAALVVFSVACFTDYLDGRLARQRNEVTDFGMLMDPIADKLLVLAAFLGFVELKLIPAWMVVIIFLRELIITGIRLFAATRKRVIPAERIGKHKTASQMVAIFSILGFLLLKEITYLYGKWGNFWELWYKRAIFYLMFVTVILTLISGVSYLMQNKDLFRNEKNN